VTAERLCLQNTLTGRKEVFRSRREKGRVKFFTCGPSIYDRPHIGNYRTFLYEDILQRYLEYLGYDVDRLINFTDVEDKAIERARETGTTVERLTEPIAERFHRDCELMRIKLPSEEIPRSSTSVDQAVVLIRQLLEKGYAYRHGDDIFYDPLKFRGFGKLFGLDMTRWPEKKVRFYKDTYSGKRWNLGDVIIWKGCRDESTDEPCWDTELGWGRPAWNVQDPAMITKHLGYQVDIACGGVDNLYRHHDYTIAVIEAVSGRKFAAYWLHGEHVRVDGRKMSKSRGNILYLQDLMERGYRSHHIRFYLSYGHYRDKLNLNEDRLHLARGKVDTFRYIAKQLSTGREDGTSDKTAARLIRSLPSLFEKRMNDDLDVKRAFEDVYSGAAELAHLKARGRLSLEDSRRIRQTLDGIDSVWRFLE
jgi:cysteinyl-tRNA synthetase